MASDDPFALSDFIESTFTQIINGVKQARAIGEDAEGIASIGYDKISNLPTGLMQSANGRLFSVIEFDVAVTATSKAEGKAGVSVVAFKGGGTLASEDQTVSRVKFSIPIAFNVY